MGWKKILFKRSGIHERLPDAPDDDQSLDERLLDITPTGEISAHCLKTDKKFSITTLKFLRAVTSQWEETTQFDLSLRIFVCAGQGFGYVPAR